MLPPASGPAAVGFLLLFIGALLASVSAPRYEMLLIRFTSALAGALGCFAFAFRRGPRWFKVLLIVLALSTLQTIVVNMLRLFPGMRMLDLL
ncbi:hypothetical protein TSACC_2818 [Terrimicrobium sacchariphilum]|uniref:Uncharacterized protein n=1 Tax=Terrimicrobium sacchariphilum TaxID=690879 RepID=A0A146G456_TERSA|nr:hypothetical protein [Terrimicrobium sacchariphilum]GAT32420.1 hypothetical protein TSACC_2818 [Terrimicrobium sacchariphilum]